MAQGRASADRNLQTSVACDHMGPKVAMFTLYVARATFWPYLSVIILQKGFSNLEIGTMTAMVRIIGSVVNPFWCVAVDHTGWLKGALTIASMAASLASLGFAYATGMVPVIMSLALYAFFSSPAKPLVDALAVISLGDNNIQYGHHRMWASIAWGLTSLLIGVVIPEGDYTPILYMHALAWVLVTVTVNAIYYKKSAGGHHMATNLSFKALKQVLAKREVALFALIVFLIASGEWMAQTYLFVRLKELDAPNIVLSLVLVVDVCSEILVFQISPSALRAFGPSGFLKCSVLAYLVKAIVYSTLENPWMVLLAEVFHGPAFACMWTASVWNAAETAPTGLQATAQGFLLLLYSGVSPFCASIVGGYTVDRMGTQAVFIANAILFVATFVVLVALQRKFHFLTEGKAHQSRDSGEINEDLEGLDD